MSWKQKLANFFIMCDDTQKICDKMQYKEASLKSKLLHWFHTLLCKQCNEHKKENAILTQSIKKTSIHFLSATEKEQLDTLIKTEIINQSSNP